MHSLIGLLIGLPNLSFARTLKKEDDLFCRDAVTSEPKQTVNVCKESQEEWESITIDKKPSFYHRQLTEECGPTCRPSCITLMLDLAMLDLVRDVSCDPSDFCSCEFDRCSSECVNEAALFDEYPKCFLEEAKCLGATVFEDKVSRVQDVWESLILDLPTLPHLEKCAIVPDDNDLCRFQDWEVVTPMDVVCDSREGCFGQNRTLFFEYCNVVEEDPACHLCNDNKCPENCAKIVEPFPSGWTTFVVSASIPFPSGINTQCDKTMGSSRSENACFLERIDIFYPQEDKNCSSPGCPHCHDCPLLSLGDHFGPLEVVGFGHQIDSSCVPCDERNKLMCDRDDLSCKELEQCSLIENCGTGVPLPWIQAFQEPTCSFCNNTEEEESPSTGGNDKKSKNFAASVSAFEQSVNSQVKETGTWVLSVVAVIALSAVALVWLRRSSNASRHAT